jgi:hypothetical protein
MKGKIKILCIIIAVSLVSFGGFKAFVVVRENIEERKQEKEREIKEERESKERERKAEIRRKEKEECLKKTPWQTMEGITLCDTIYEARDKMPSRGTMNYHDDGSRSIYCVDCSGKKTYYIKADYNKKVYSVDIDKTYYDKPDYLSILEKLKDVNSSIDMGQVKSSEWHDSWCNGSRSPLLGVCEGSTEHHNAKEWCFGDCKYAKQFSSGEWYDTECREYGKCFVYEYRYSTYDGRYTLSVRLYNNQRSQDQITHSHEYHEKEKRRKTSQF